MKKQSKQLSLKERNRIYSFYVEFRLIKEISFEQFCNKYINKIKKEELYIKFLINENN